MSEKRFGSAWPLGLAVGFVFGVADLILTWLRPLEDDTGPVLLRFYGPMFLCWIFAAFVRARRTGRLSSGVLEGAVFAFATFSGFVVLNFVRVNLFLYQLTHRPDWQTMMRRFHANESGTLRMFVNVAYLKGTPFKMLVASIVGAIMGVIGGTLGRLAHRSRLASADAGVATTRTQL